MATHNSTNLGLTNHLSNRHSILTTIIPTSNHHILPQCRGSLVIQQVLPRVRLMDLIRNTIIQQLLMLKRAQPQEW
jgi:hypothetical protein